MNLNPLSLPVISAEPAVTTWQGFRADGPLPGWDAATASPEPEAGQGIYATEAVVNLLPQLAADDRPVELLAPAGGPDAAFAAFHHGADAIYLGLQKFSARAEAENFTLAEVGEVTAYAHSLSPKRRVFVTINTLIRQDELLELVSDLAALAEIGVDALIVQDLGVAQIVREHFPTLELHASTQLAVHNRAGAEALKALGFTRVVLARELTFEEVYDITAASGLETEVFVHGALCYSYSGLCLFSAQTLGRSGNRGKCAYSCRDSYEVEGAPQALRDGTPTRRDPSTGFPFSMKDLALPDHLPALRSAGVSCFKIEGRKKSPLYVATTTNYYRGLIDHSLPEAERPEREAELQTVFSRPWTKLFVQSHKDKEVADRDTVGHRGTPIGRVEAVRDGAGLGARISLTTARAIERHDGLQVDLPVLGKPFGFPVDHLWIAGPGGRLREVFAAPAGSRIEVGLPAGHPELPAGAPVYCSSSQAVKLKYRHDRPKPGLYRARQAMHVTLRVAADRLVAEGRVGDVTAVQILTGEFPEAREPGQMEVAGRVAFEKLGDTEFALGEFVVENPGGRFAPVSRLNQLRRDLVAAMTDAVAGARNVNNARVTAIVAGGHYPTVVSESFAWSIKIDRVEYVDAFEAEDWAGVEEVVVDIARDHRATLVEQLQALGERIGREKIRLALPAITRKWEEKGIVQKIEKLREAGWSKWEAANVSAWSYLAPTGDIDLATDWSVYVMNRAAAQAVLAMGATRFALSPEDGRANMQPLLAEFGDRAVLIVHQDTPQFIAESCAYANLIGGCPGKANCSFESMEMVSSHGERVTALDYHCRTIVLNDGPYCVSHRLREIAKLGARHLRADFIYRRYSPIESRDRWRAVRAGQAIPGALGANFDRGIL